MWVLLEGKSHGDEAIHCDEIFRFSAPEVQETIAKFETSVVVMKVGGF